jgi:hypothetical protein
MNRVCRNSLKTLVLRNQQVLNKNNFNVWRSFISIQFYLNEGVGEPWAGHVNEIPSPADILKADRSTIEENFGLADPMGSELEQLEKK